MIKFFLFLSVITGLTYYANARGFNYYEQSYCYVVRWSLQSLCDHIFDPYESKDIWSMPTFREIIIPDPELIKPGDVVFVRNANKFFKEIHPQIQNPYIILTHGDYQQAFGTGFLKYLDDEKVIAWFTIHTRTKEHKKLFAIPLGIDQRNLPHFQDWKNLNKCFFDLRLQPKDKLIYINFNVNTAKRKHLKELWQGQEDDCFYSRSNKKHSEYFKEMATCKFTLCPEGWGPDTYRIWEAVYVGSIPVIQKTTEPLMKLYADLPILVVDDLKKVTKDFLHQEYEKIINKKDYNFNKLNVRYWIEKIDDVRRKFLENYQPAK